MDRTRVVALSRGALVTACIALSCVAACASSSQLADAPIVRSRDVAEEAAERYWAEARADDRVDQLLDEYGVAGVFVIAVPHRPGSAVVVARFEETAPDDAWSLEESDVCAIGHEPGMTGVAWSVVNDRLSPSVSPRWGEIDCVGSLPLPSG